MAEIIETNIFDQEEIHPNCTVQILRNSITDEQAAYDEIGLTDEQNALFGYSGQMILKAEPQKEENAHD